MCEHPRFRCTEEDKGPSPRPLSSPSQSAQACPHGSTSRLPRLFTTPENDSVVLSLQGAPPHTQLIRGTGNDPVAFLQPRRLHQADQRLATGVWLLELRKIRTCRWLNLTVTKLHVALPRFVPRGKTHSGERHKAEVRRGAEAKSGSL